MVTTDRRHAVMIPGRPRPLHAGRHVARPALDDEHPQFGDDAEDCGDHRTVQRVDEHGWERAPGRGLREDPPGGEDRSANRPQPAQVILQRVIESGSKLRTEWVTEILRHIYELLVTSGLARRGRVRPERHALAQPSGLPPLADARGPPHAKGDGPAVLPTILATRSRSASCGRWPTTIEGRAGRQSADGCQINS